MRKSSGERFFPVAWYDVLNGRSSLPRIALEGMNAVMPYHTPDADPGGYLDAAKASGIRVLLELPRDLVKRTDREGVARFVHTYERHSALLGWYLADEPSINQELGPLSAENAQALYETIKAEDPEHPVAIAFGVGEDAAAYRSAMDVMMFDDYPCWQEEGEFHRFRDWTTRMTKAAAVARREDGFFPVIQAYGEPRPFLGLGRARRLPTAGEQRYMVFSALQVRATGLFFWTHTLADPAWVDTVLVPIVTQLNQMRPALAAGEEPGLVSVWRPEVRATTFRDPKKGTTFIVAVHHGDGSVNAPLKLHRDLSAHGTAELLSDPPQLVEISDGTLEQTLGRFEVKVYRLGDR